MGISLHVWSLCKIRVKLCKWKWVRISCPGVGCPWGLKTGFWHFSMIQDISCCIDINVHGQMERILKIDCAPKFRVNINKEHPPTPNTSLIRTCNNPYYCSVSFESDILSSWEKKKRHFPILMGQQLSRNGVQQEMESGVLGTTELGCTVSRNSPRKEALRKICFLTYRFSPLAFFIVDSLRPGDSLCSHLMASCKAMARLTFQTMGDEVQVSTHNQQQDRRPGQQRGNIHFEKGYPKPDYENHIKAHIYKTQPLPSKLTFDL